MFSQTNSELMLYCVFFAGVILFSLIDKRNKQLLSDTDKERIKNIIPVYVWLPLVVTLTGFPIFFIGSVNYRFLLLAELTLGLFIGMTAWSYRIWKTNNLGLPVEYLEKARKLNLTYCIFNFVYLISVFSLILAKWKTEDFKIFLK